MDVLPFDVARICLHSVDSVSDSIALMSVNKWWYHETKTAETLWRRLCETTFASLRGIPGEPECGWYGVYVMQIRAPTITSLHIDLNEYLSILHSTASLAGYRMHVVVKCAGEAPLLDWTGDVADAFSPQGTCVIPIFEADEVPSRFCDAHDSIWDSVCVRISMIKDFQTIVVLDHTDGLVEDDFFFMGQFVLLHAEAELQIDAQFGTFTTWITPVEQIDEIATIHEGPLWLEIDFRRSYSMGEYKLYDDSFDRWGHMSHPFMARMLEIVFESSK